MRSFIVLVFLCLNLKVAAQDENIIARLKAQKELNKCELVSINAADIIAKKMELHEYDSVGIVIKALTILCGTTEWSQRALIINTILSKQDATEAIETYFEDDFHFVLRNRLNDSKRPDFGYIYSRNPSYFGYLPLRHPIDSITSKIASILLFSAKLNTNEKQICYLFSGDIEQFDKELYKRKNRSSFISNHIITENFNYRNHYLAFNVYTGVYKPLGSSKVFSTDPIIGLTFSSPLRFNFLVELGIKARININDKNFNYYALGDTNNVNSESSIFFGGIFGYQVYKNQKLRIIPKVGIGIESVDTGISEKKSRDETKYYDVETIHLSAGISLMVPVLKRNYIGIELNYHFTPYQLVDNLHTKFNSSAISSEIFIRF